jgi:hypothetical protein
MGRFELNTVKSTEKKSHKKEKKSKHKKEKEKKGNIIETFEPKDENCAKKKCCFAVQNVWDHRNYADLERKSKKEKEKKKIP